MRVSLGDPFRATEVASTLPPAPSAAASTGSPSETPFAHLLEGIGRELGRGEATTRAAIASIAGGRDLGPGQLIALQTGVYRYSEAIDLASRLVDRATGDVKTVLQGSAQ
jgi:hypothetical protein